MSGVDVVIILAVGAFGLASVVAHAMIITRLETIEGNTNYIEQKEEQIMATLDEITAAVTRVSDKVDAGSASLDAIEADIADLKAQVAAGGMTAEQETAALAQIADLEAKVSAQADRLAGIDEATPGIPAPEPTPEP